MARRANSTLNLSPVKVLYLPEQKASHSSCGVPCGEPGEGEGLGAGSSGVGVVMLTYYYRETYGGDTYHGNAN